MHLRVRDALGPRSVIRRSVLTADGHAIGTVTADHIAVFGGGTRSEYTYQPNDEGRAKGLSVLSATSLKKLYDSIEKQLLQTCTAPPGD